MLSKKITICVFCWNEAARIESFLSKIQGIFQILVVDNCSTDETADRAASMGIDVISVKNPGFIETQEVMGPVQEKCTTEYILIASVSEYIPLALLKFYAKVAHEGKYDVVRAFRVSVTAGQPIPISGTPKRDAHTELRFFRKGAIDFSKNMVHGRGRITVEPERIVSVARNEDLHFYQFRDYDCSRTEEKHRAYNDVLAKQRFAAGVKFHWTKAFVFSAKEFLNSYIRFGSWRFGSLGFIHSFYRFQMELNIWFRLWEWENQISGPDVRMANKKFRERMEDRDKAELEKNGF